MTINGINSANAQTSQMGMNPMADSFSKNIQNQITNAQKQLQELSSNKEMSLEEKMKKRQEIQQQINDLNMQLRQHQVETRKEKLQAKDSSMGEMSGGANKKADGKGAGFSQAGMAAMISADASIKQAQTQSQVATSMKGRASILESEIKMDASLGANVDEKKAELADVTQKAQSATASQISILADASKAMEKAAQTESMNEKTADKSEKEENDSSAEVQDEDAENAQVQDEDAGNAQVQDAQPAEAAVLEAQAAQETVYSHVDVLL